MLSVPLKKPYLCYLINVHMYIISKPFVWKINMVSTFVSC